jgi:hypothetical protein
VLQNIAEASSTFVLTLRTRHIAVNAGGPKIWSDGQIPSASLRLLRRVEPQQNNEASTVKKTT